MAVLPALYPNHLANELARGQSVHRLPTAGRPCEMECVAVDGFANAALRDELLHRAEVDQQARRACTPLFAKAPDRAVDRADLTLEEQKLIDQVVEVDQDNTGWLIELVQRQGWPTRSQVGEQAAEAAWLLVQHGDHNPAWQRRCLDLMCAAPDDEASPEAIAYLTDRVLLSEGKPQVYGTQMMMVNGEYQPRDLRDAETVDRRRAAVGLGTLLEYRQWMNDEREVL